MIQPTAGKNTHTVCCAHYTYNDFKKRRYANVIELVTIPGGRRLSGAESIDLSFCLDPAGLSLQYSNGHSPTHRWYRQNIPRNPQQNTAQKPLFYTKGYLQLLIFSPYPSDTHKKFRHLQRKIAELISVTHCILLRISCEEKLERPFDQSQRKFPRQLYEDPQQPQSYQKTRFSPIVQIHFERPSHTLSIYVPLHYR